MIWEDLLREKGINRYTAIVNKRDFWVTFCLRQAILHVLSRGKQQLTLFARLEDRIALIALAKVITSCPISASLRGRVPPSAPAGDIWKDGY